MDWVRLFEDNQIEYVTRGPNTKRGEVSIRCPWCGPDDPSQHLGINLATDSWGCLRNARHRGRTTTFLLSSLLGCSQHQAAIIARQYDAGDPEALPDAADLFALTSEPLNGAEAPSNEPMTMPGDFRYIEPYGLTKPYWDYLVNRGFPQPRNMIRYFGLRACLLGRFKNRVIIPLWGGPSHTKLIGWTGRAITKAVNAPRYLSTDERIKQTVFNFDNLRRRGGRLLTVVEGPMDALKLDYYGVKYDARATCLFGANITPGQAGCLNELCQRFDHVALMLDPGTVEQSYDVRAWLIRPNVSEAPEIDAEDPGAMTGEQVVHYINEMRPRFLRAKR